jgi:hypothetical protein
MEPEDTLCNFERTTLLSLKLAADALLAQPDAIPDTLEVELVIFHDRLEQALLPTKSG